MGSRKAEAANPADLPPPAVIARQIEADLKAALREIAAVVRSLEQPAAAIERPEETVLFDL